MFYETQHSLSADLLSAYLGEDLLFPPHLHGAFELIAVLAGRMEVQVDRCPYTLEAGRAVLVFPDQVHGLESAPHSRHLVALFSPSYVKTFSSAHSAQVPVTADLCLPPALLDALCRMKKEDSVLRLKGLLYTLCAEFEEGREYRERSREENALLMRIFSFVGANYASDCSLRLLASRLGYSYVYLSRYFRERTGLTFSEYVARTRIGEACARLTGTEDSVTQIAPDCGFASLRSFRRTFRAQTGLSPAEYRKSGGGAR